ncbi:MAG: caspase family protein, partial [Candidatus Moranbacteria bacterium]|nr:caspase family protein [Candidatus Moranbacteria bacterium]
MQISKKQVLSESDRKKLDSIESELKGKPVKVSTVVDPSVGGVTGALGDAIPSGGKKYAILVGLANYPGTVNDLCVVDAKTGENYPTMEDGLAYYCKDEDTVHMKQALVDEYGYDAENIYTFSDAGANFDSIKSRIDELVGTETAPGKLTADDELVFFFSGHGSTGIAYDGTGAEELSKDEDLDEAIVIYDQEYDENAFLNDPAYAASYVAGDSAFIWDDQLRAWFANSLTDRIFFAFDTCRAGGMDDLQSAGRVLAMSSTESQSSYTYYLGGTQTDVDVIQSSEGLFAHYFVRRAMSDELGDGSNPLSKKDPTKYDGNVAVEEAFSYAYPIVRTATGNRQNPTLNDK